MEAQNVENKVNQIADYVAFSVISGQTLEAVLFKFEQDLPHFAQFWALVKSKAIEKLKELNNIDSSVAAPELLEQMGSKLETRGLKPTYKKLSDYSILIEKSDNKAVYAGDISLKTVLKHIKEISINCAPQVSKLAAHLKGDSEMQSVFNVWHWIKTNVKYEFDAPGKEELRTPARIYADRFTGVDCDDYSILAASLLYNMGYKPYFKVVQFNNKPGFGHIYVVLNGIVLDCCLTRFNEHPINITRSMNTYLLSGTPENEKDIIILDSANNLGDAAQITQGVFGAVSSIGSAVPPPIGTIMGVLGGIGAAIASLFRGKPTISKEKYLEQMKQFVDNTNQLLSKVNIDTPSSVLSSVHLALIDLRQAQQQANVNIIKDYGIPNDAYLQVKNAIDSAYTKFTQLVTQINTRFAQWEKSLKTAAMLYAKGDKSQAVNIATLWKGMQTYKPGISPDRYFGDEIVNFDPNKTEVVVGRKGTQVFPSNNAITKEIYNIMNNAASVLNNQTGGAIFTPAPVTPTPGAQTPGTQTPGTVDIPTAPTKAGMGAGGIVLGLAAAGLLATLVFKGRN